MRWQASLFASHDPPIVPAIGLPHCDPERRQLDEYSWVDYAANWLHGADQLFGELRSTMPWTTRTVKMYDRMVVEPRLSSWWTTSGPTAFPIPIFSELRTILGSVYGRNFDSIGCNYYRDGKDSVAWHGDKLPFSRLGREEQPIIAIVSLGSRRPFLLRPTRADHLGGGSGRRSIRFELGDGDLLVMGGRSQIDWQHCVPKVARSGPRISVTYREALEVAPERPRPDVPHGRTVPRLSPP